MGYTWDTKSVFWEVLFSQTNMGQEEEEKEADKGRNVFERPPPSFFLSPVVQSYLQNHLS